MSCLYIDKKSATLKIEGKALRIYDNQGLSTTVPLELVDRLCIKGSTQLSASVLAKLGQQDIPVLILGGLTATPSLLLPSFRQDAQRRLVQMQLSTKMAFALSFAKSLVRKKIEGQQQVCQELFSHSQLSPLLAKSVDESFALHLSQVDNIKALASLLGVEGSAANLYFKQWAQLLPPSLSFNGRNKRPPKDPVNAILSLGYTLLHNEWVRHIYLMGLDPYIGFSHQTKFGRESLASDLLEPLRPIYDRWALSLFKERILRVEDFSSKDGACLLGKAGRVRFYQEYEGWLKGIQSQIRQTKLSLFEYFSNAVDDWPESTKKDPALLFDTNSININIVE